MQGRAHGDPRHGRADATAGRGAETKAHKGCRHEDVPRPSSTAGGNTDAGSRSRRAGAAVAGISQSAVTTELAVSTDVQDWASADRIRALSHSQQILDTGESKRVWTLSRSFHVFAVFKDHAGIARAAEPPCDGTVNAQS